MTEPLKAQESAAEWRQQLTPEQYRMTREHGTERRFFGEGLSDQLWCTLLPLIRPSGTFSRKGRREGVAPPHHNFTVLSRAAQHAVVAFSPRGRRCPKGG